MINDLRYALRQLLKNPGFTGIAVLILGLGIGANTAIFSIVNALLFKPISVEAPQELARLHQKHLNPDGGFRAFSYPNFVDIRAGNDAFQDVTAFHVTMVGLSEGDTTRRVFAMTAAANYFRTFGVKLPIGREFLPEEEQPDAGIASAIVSYSYWKNHGGDSNILAQPLKINGRDFQVVGVAPENFAGFSALMSCDVYVPLGVQQWLVNDFMNQKGRTLSDRNNHALMLVGRLRDGLSREQAQGRLQPLAEQLRQAYPDANRDYTLVLSPPSRLSINVAPSKDNQMAGVTALLLPMSGVVLLIASLNLANMLLARGTARHKEFAIRSALGGSRLQIARQLICEGFLLSLAGGVFAILLASWVSHLLGKTFASKLPFATIILDSRPDVRVLLATLVCCVLATLIASLFPAVRLSRVDVMRDLKEQGTEGRQDRSNWKLFAPRNLLVSSQVALSFVLLAVAALFYRGARNASEANPGFRFEQGIVAELDSGLAGYDQAKGRQTYRAVLERVRQLPGVESASLASSIPFGLFSDDRRIGRPGTKQAQQEGQKLGESEQPVFAHFTLITEDYFQSLGAPMVRGREFTRLEAEGEAPAPVAILSEAAAQRLWPGEDPIGRQFEILDGGKNGQPTVVEVVGIAPGFKAAIGDAEASPYLYVPLGQAFQSMVNLHVRVSAPGIEAERALVPTVRSAIKSVDDQLPVLSMNTLRDFHNESFVMWMFNAGARMLAIFALLALTLATVGLYGLKSFIVARRTRELGIRLALGATEKQVVWLVLRNGLSTTAAGLAVGLVLALGAGFLMRSMLLGVSAADALSFSVAALALGTAAFVASYFPARRAARVDPIQALRTE